MRNRRIRTLLTALLVLGLLVAAVPASAGQAVERPFSEKLSGYLVDMHEPDEGQCSAPSLWVSTTVGTGKISHLGRVTWVEKHCFQMDGTFGDVELVITAANGDQLFATFVGASGTVSETGWFDPVTGYMEVTGTGSIIYDASNSGAGRMK